ncbi:hypothetical protein [Pandoraea communis]|uniref:hypothetical protein n=1 Tax=Pandoraea communis TaxID=2508297 RepID=UPI0025A67070|nr:hypothetical protein [Pandoraea communis]MDM8356183.1 hypothetical protein [Pandoraea communis]
MRKIKIFSFWVAALLFTSNAYAANIGDMFANSLSSFEALTKLAQFSGYIIGVFMIISAIFKMSQLGKGGGGGQQVSPKKPLVLFFCGVGVFALTSTVSIATATLAMGTGPGAILAESGTGALSGFSSQAIQSLYTFLRLYGYISFIRGFLQINMSAQPNGQQGMLFRGITHIVGGVIMINYQLWHQILGNTFGNSLPF